MFLSIQSRPVVPLLVTRRRIRRPRSTERPAVTSKGAAFLFFSRLLFASGSYEEAPRPFGYRGVLRMHVAPIRPRFSFSVSDPPGVVIERLRAGCELAEHRCVCRLVGSHMDITVVRGDRHRWSPCVSLEVEEDGTGSCVRAIVGPHPSAWTFYALSGMALVFLLMVLLVVASAQRTLGGEPTALWWAGACALMLAGPLRRVASGPSAGAVADSPPSRRDRALAPGFRSRREPGWVLGRAVGVRFCHAGRSGAFVCAVRFR